MTAHPFLALWAFGFAFSLGAMARGYGRNRAEGRHKRFDEATIAWASFFMLLVASLWFVFLSAYLVVKLWEALDS